MPTWNFPTFKWIFRDFDFQGPKCVEAEEICPKYVILMNVEFT